MTVTVNEEEIKLVLDRLDTVKLEPLMLRALLLPEEEATDEDKKEIQEAKNEIAKNCADFFVSGYYFTKSQKSCKEITQQTPASTN